MSVNSESTPLLNRALINSYNQRPWYKKKRFYLNLIRRSLAEFLGTALYVFVGVSSVSNIVAADPKAFTSWGIDRHFSLPAATAIVVALAFGLAYGGLMSATMDVSGGHLNPAVTLAVFIAGGVNVVAAVLYLFAQIIGGIAGSACVLAYNYGFTVPNGGEGLSDGDQYNFSVVSYGVTSLRHGINPLQGILVEMLLTLMLVLVFLHTTMRGSSESRSTAPIMVGLTVVAGTLSGYSLTGGSMNPARSFGPPSVSNGGQFWNDHYVYWIGPFLGALIGGGAYRLILSPRPLLPLVDKEDIKYGS